MVRRRPTSALDDDASSRHRIEIVHESLLTAWPRLVRWRAQDAEGAQLRDELREAARAWDEHERPADRLWTGTAFREFQLWRERYPGGLTETEGAFARGMAEHAGRRRKRWRFAVTVVIAVLVAGLGTIGALWRQSEASRHEAVSEARRAEANALLALGRGELDSYPSATLAYARRSLELADTGAGRRLAVEALWRGPTARILPLDNTSSWSAEFSPDGRWLASYTFSENVLLFPDDGGAPRVFGGHVLPTGPPDVAFTPDGNALLTMPPRPPHRVRVLSVPDGRELRWLAPELGGDPESYCGLDWLPEGPLFCVREGAEPDVVARLELVPSDGAPSRILGSVLWSLLPKSGVIYWPDQSGSRLAWARGQRIFLRPLAGPATTSEREVARIEGGRVRYPFFSPRGDSLAVVQDGGRLTLLPLDRDPSAPRRPRVFHLENPDDMFYPEFDAAGSSIAWGSSAERSISVWRLDGPPGAEPVVLRRGATLGTKRGVFHPDGNWLAVANQDSLTLWNVGRPQPFVLRGHESPIYHVQFTPDSRWLVSCGYQDGARVWPLDPQIGVSRAIGLAGVSLCQGLALAPDGKRMLLGGPRGAHVVPLGDGEQWVLTRRPPDGGIFGVAFDAFGQRAAVSPAFGPSLPKKLRIWDLESDAPPRELPLAPPGESEEGFDWGVHQLAFTPEGDLLAAGSGGIRRFDPEEEPGAAEWIWELDREWNASMSSSRDGRRLIARAFLRVGSGSANHRVVLLDLAEGTRRTITTHGSRVEAVALDPSGEIIVTGDAEGTIRVGPANGGEPHLLFGHSDAVNRMSSPLAVSPDGRWIASAAGDEIRLWPMPDVTKPPLHTLPLEQLLAKLGELTNVQVVPDDASPTGYKVEIGPFPGWKDVPTW